MKNGGEENDLHLRTLEVAQIQEDEYFGSLIADDLKGILRDIREQHRSDTMTADESSLVATVQGQLQDAMNFEGSSEEKQVRSFLATFGIDYDKLSKEQFVSLIEILKLSKYLKSPINQRGKARPQLQHGKGKKTKISKSHISLKGLIWLSLTVLLDGTNMTAISYRSAVPIAVQSKVPCYEHRAQNQFCLRRSVHQTFYS